MGRDMSALADFSTEDFVLNYVHTFGGKHLLQQFLIHWPMRMGIRTMTVSTVAIDVNGVKTLFTKVLVRMA